jgi:hypothetical protein
MINKKKLSKFVLIGVGIHTFAELCGIIGEAQATATLHGFYPEEVDKFVYVLENADDFKGVAPYYKRAKCKLIAKASKILIESGYFE